MKVQITDQSKEKITLKELKLVRELIKEFKTDWPSEEDILIEASRLLCFSWSEIIKVNLGDFEKVFEVKAEMLKNRYVINSYAVDSAHLDVLISGLVKFRYVICEISIFLGDLISLKQNKCSSQDVASRCHICPYIKNYNLAIYGLYGTQE